MKKPQKSPLALKSYLYVGICVLLMLLSLCAEAKASSRQLKPGNTVIDTTLFIDIESALKLYQKNMHFPRLVTRFYDRNHFTPVWVLPQDKARLTWQAMLMLDCVLQYGLNHADYHPADLKYEQLQQIMEKPNSVSSADKARYEVMLTDAMLAFINHLHYGKLNPDFSTAKIEEASAFSAESILQAALHSIDFISAVSNVQPKSEQYAVLQDQLRLATGQYIGDCYEIPEETIRKMAINLERLRWLGDTEATFVQINIPSYTLSFCKPDTTYQFRVVVGKPSTPTPTLKSAITHFATAPEWRVPQKIFVKELLPKALKDTTYLEANHFAVYNDKGGYLVPDQKKLITIIRNAKHYYARQSGGCDNALGLIVFRFANPYDVYLHDTPQQALFKQSDRAFSHGCVRVEQALQFAALLLKNDGNAGKLPAMQKAMANYQNKTFILHKRMPVKITYLTCGVKDGLLVTYKDVYLLDKALEQALYYTAPQLVLK